MTREPHIQTLALEWLYRMAASAEHSRYAIALQDMLAERGVDVDVTERAPLRARWPR